MLNIETTERNAVVTSHWIRRVGKSLQLEHRELIIVRN